MPSHAPAIMVLEDGRTFHGESYGAEGETFGEAVFNTGMTGYQETLTDPSYHRQVVVMTAPHIGNYGVNDDDAESRRIWVAGYVVRDPSRVASNWRAQRTLDHDLLDQFDEHYMGHHATLAAWAEEMCDDLGFTLEAGGHLPATLQPYVHIDYQALGRDMEIEGDVTSVEAEGGGVWMFREL